MKLNDFVFLCAEIVAKSEFFLMQLVFSIVTYFKKDKIFNGIVLLLKKKNNQN